MRFARNLLFLALILSAARAAVADKPNELAQAKTAIEARAAAIRTAFAEHDAAAIAAFWTPDGDFVNSDGRRVEGREAIEKAWAQFFQENPDVTLRTSLLSVRQIAPGVVVNDAIAEASPRPAGPPKEYRFSLVNVKKKGKWLVAAAREAALPIPSNYEYLKEMEWMIGDWHAARDNAILQSKCDWTPNKNFIIRSYTVDRQGRLDIGGLQRIAWDPVGRRITTSSIDSDGSVFQGVMTRRDNRWTEKETGTLRDGTPVSSTTIITRIDNDTFTLRCVQRTVGGVPQDDIDTIKIQRKTSGE